MNVKKEGKGVNNRELGILLERREPLGKDAETELGEKLVEDTAV